jgi:hypothetical protein
MLQKIGKTYVAGVEGHGGEANLEDLPLPLISVQVVTRLDIGVGIVHGEAKV